MADDCVGGITTVRQVTDLAAFLAGFVAGEGCFTAQLSHGRFAFRVGLGARDRGMCEQLLSFFGVGHLAEWPRRRPHYDDEVAYVVGSLRELVTVIVPFMDEHLPPSYKRDQYLVWRADLLDYWERWAKRVRPCTVDGCEQPRRAKGLCRHHYFVEVEGPKRLRGRAPP
ncbi:hypothetical protein BH18ACT4_BH18ACT4_09360 [soil metagenome]